MAKEVAVKKEVEFMVLANANAAIEALRSNLEGEALSPMDLDRVVIPAGGGMQWTVPTLDGDEIVQEITGVIVGVQNCRAYWMQDFGGSGTPPDCVSEDGHTGSGNPGGPCKTCQYAEFGSDSRGKGQACKQIKRLFVIRPVSMLPLVINLPPTSIRSATRYLLRLAGNGHKYQGVITRVTLEKTKNTDGIPYSTAIFAMVGVLDATQATIMEEYAKSMGPLLRRPVTSADYPMGEE